eukprot:TRINITY_DN12333_c3_g1_i1.p1 TRINITY_DN12333_c3_g1~~TRINITY_DN12333_c3_g1_i1.p1  ORF type:complete len:466 (+),score=44.62 TRINITY_DN12333_c3_g1_i1:164-1399(+)
MRRPRLSLAIPTRQGDLRDGASSSARDAQAKFAETFELGESLGEGAYAVVKRAQRRDNASVLAVKCVRSAESEHHRLASEEFAMLQSAQCPEIVAAWALYECGKSLYLCMELCNAGDVYSYVTANGPFSNAHSSSLCGQLLRGIRCIHSKRIVHCDIKHANILLHENEAGLNIKLADFNSAQRVGSRCSAVPLSCRGTKMFCAPELQLYGVWNERVDIWSCGLCFYFMLYGRLPFDASSSESINQLLAGKLPRALWERTDAVTTHLIQQCLTVDGKERPPALELAQHCLFFDGASDRARSRDRPRKRLLGCAGVGSSCSQDFAHLLSCGLIRTEASKAVCASPPALSRSAGLQSQLLSKRVLEPYPGDSTRLLYERIFSDVDHSFRQLAHIKFLRCLCGDDKQPRRLAHTC